MADNQNWLKVGHRTVVKDKNVEGTIRFIGETEFAPGVWVGVELDDPKGKNNGTVKGKAYFECPDQHGLMVRSNQLEPPDKGLKPGVEPSDEWLKPGVRVLVKDKNLHGTIRFIGDTEFAPGVWVGVELDEPKGKNNGTVKDKVYFECRDKHGLMVRIPQVEPVDSLSAKKRVPPSSSGIKSPSSGSPAVKRSQLPKSSKNLQESSGNTPVGSPRASQKSSPVVPPKVEEPTQPPAPTKTPPTATTFAPTSAPPTVVVEGPNDVVKDLQQRLAILQQKRSEDKAKLKELDKFRLQYQQMVEYKTKWTESQTDLQQQLKQAKKEAREAQLTKEHVEEELHELSDAVEIATLDKEMAEEKCEGLQAENEALKERIQELSLDLEIIQNEISESGYEGAAASGQLKQLEQQNTRLKEALMRLRDITNEDKLEHQQVAKELEKQTHALTTVSNQKERLEEELKAAEDVISVLKEQVDVAMGAEDMVEKLTEQNLQLEEDLAQANEAISDLEALKELTEQQEEIRIEVEHDLREEVDMNMNTIRQLEQKMDASQETIVDQQQTIEKFRELVKHLQTDLSEVRQQVKEDENETFASSIATHDSIMNQLKSTAASQSYSRTIDYELRKLEAQQSAEIIDHLKSFIPNSFVISGGDYDALNVTMLLPRLSLKAELIMDQLKQQANVDSVLSNLNNAKHDPQTDFQTFVAYLCYKMSLFQNLVNVVMRILNECDVSLYKQVGSLRDDLTLHERVMDALIDLLKKEQLDESVPLNGIDKAINHFENLISNRLSFEPQSGAIDKFNDQVKVVTAACDYCSLEIIRLRHFAKEGSGFHAQLKELETFNSDVRQSCRRARRRLPSPRSGKIISCPPSLFPSVISQQSLLVEGFKSLYSQLHLRQQSLTDNEVLSSGELEHCLMELSKGLCQKFENIGLTLSDEQSIHLCLSKMAKNLEEFLNDLQNGVYDTEAPKIQVTSPLVARSLTVKAELSDTENLKYRVEEKNEEILELKKNLKLKVVEIGEINTKVELLGKKLELADEECVRKVEEQKLETERVKTVMDQMEEKFNKAIAILQKDMENLEEERETLKHQLETQSRTPIPADISGTRRSLSLSGRKSLSALMGRAQSLSVAPPSVSSSSSSEQAREEIPQFNSSPLLLAQVDSLRKALYYSQDENIRLKASAVKVKMASLPPLNVPKRSVWPKPGEPSDNMNRSDMEKSFSKRTNDLLKELNNIVKHCCVVDITKRNGKTRESFACQMSTLLELRQRIDKLREESMVSLASGHPGATTLSPIRTFVTPHFIKALSEATNATQLLAKLHLPQPPDGREADGVCRKLLLSSNQFQTLHNLVVS